MSVTTKSKAAKRRRSRLKQSYGAAEFKAHCLELMDEVERTRMPVVVTKRGKPVVRIVPMENDERPLFGALKGVVTYMGDIVAPTGEDWEAER